MHQSMLSPRVVGPGIPGAFDCISSPMGRDNKRFDVTQHPKDGGVWKDLARAWNLV